MADKPNILFIMTDQQRFDCLGANGNAIIRTPNLDALAQRSANLQNLFVQAPVCVPSRICFFTGRYAHAHRNRVNDTPLKADEVLLPEYLKKAGYATSVVGKLHFNPPTPDEAIRRGFETVFLHDGLRKNEPFSAYAAWRRANDPNHHAPFKALAQDVPRGKNPYRSALPDEYTETTWVGVRTCAEIKRLAAANKPFFLFSSFFKPHAPFEVPAPFDSMYDYMEFPLPKPVDVDYILSLPKPLQVLILRGDNQFFMPPEELQWIYRSYYGAVSHIDREVGRMLDALDAAGCLDRTIIVFVSDHGDLLLEHGIEGKNVFFESAIHVPCLIAWPGVVRPGPLSQLIETVDLFPTLLGLAGIEEPYHCQGRSFAGRYVERDCVFAENVIPEVITTGNLDFPFVKGKGVGGIQHPDAKMVRTQKWKLNYYVGHGGELYDLENDPLEECNLYDERSSQRIVHELQSRLLDWMITSDETEQIAERWLL